MNLKKDYTNLYKHWLAEFDQAELTPLFQEDFNSYKNSVNKIIDYQKTKHSWYIKNFATCLSQNF
jgi:hypothetical protein